MTDYRNFLISQGLTEKELSEKDFCKAREQAERKIRMNHKPKSYLDVLLPDMVREIFISRYTMDIYQLHQELRELKVN